MKHAHVHLISALWAELGEVPLKRREAPLRVLDAGCGYGSLMIDILDTLEGRFGDCGIEVFGYEVHEHRGSTPGYRDAILSRLRTRFPKVDWKERVRLGSAAEAWPFADVCFDAVVSNQVVEHVACLDSFFSEAGRVSRPDAVGVHFYPSREILVEPHSGVPLAHWMASPRVLDRWLRLASRWRLGKFPRYRRERGHDLNRFCREFADYLGRYVFFRGNGSIRRVAAAGGAPSGFGYDAALALRAVGDDWQPYAYPRPTRLGARSLLAPFACSTLVQRGASGRVLALAGTLSPV